MRYFSLFLVLSLILLTDTANLSRIFPNVNKSTLFVHIAKQWCGSGQFFSASASASTLTDSASASGFARRICMNSDEYWAETEEKRFIVGKHLPKFEQQLWNRPEAEAAHF
jgi:hypothetical protein